jgi:ketosteroid isomerase-like protein
MLCLAGFGASPARAKGVHHTQREAKEEISRLEEQWRTAVMTSDVALMDKLLSDDYVGISMNGQENTKLMQLDRLRTRNLAITRLDLSEVKIKLVGTVAIVTSLAQVEGTNEGKDMRGLYRYTRIYQRLPNGTWKITNFEATRVPVPPGERLARQRQMTP